VRRRLRTGLWTALVILILVAQLLPFPPADNPPVTGSIQPPPDVAAILHKGCYDCHSNETLWPWYSHVIPMKWLVRRHVQQGRKQLNLSEWAAYRADERTHLLEEMAEVVEMGEMPLPSYLRLHPEAELTPDEVARLVEWAREGSSVEG
jgi:hypothetical protein